MFECLKTDVLGCLPFLELVWFVFSQYCFAFASLLLYCNTSAIYRPKEQLMYASMGAFIKGWLQKDLKLYI